VTVCSYSERVGGDGLGGRKGGREGGRKEGRNGGRVEGRKGGRKEEGRKGGREEGSKEGREEGRNKFLVHELFAPSAVVFSLFADLYFVQL
jgi:hypothetical protein